MMFPWAVGYEPVTGVFEAGRSWVGHHLAHHKHVSRRAHDVEHKGPRDYGGKQVVPATRASAIASPVVNSIAGANPATRYRGLSR